MTAVAVSMNGENRELNTDNLLDALASWGYRQDDVAVAVNGDFVPRSRYAGFQLSNRDCVDVVGRVQGG